MSPLATRHRTRRNRGLRCITLEIHESEIAELTRRGLLVSNAQGDRTAVRNGILPLSQ